MDAPLLVLAISLKREGHGSLTATHILGGWRKGAQELGRGGVFRGQPAITRRRVQPLEFRSESGLDGAPRSTGRPPSGLRSSGNALS